MGRQMEEETQFSSSSEGSGLEKALSLQQSLRRDMNIEALLSQLLHESGVRLGLWDESGILGK